MFFGGLYNGGSTWISRALPGPRRRRMPPPPAIWGLMMDHGFLDEDADSLELSRTSRAVRAAMREAARLRAAWVYHLMVRLLGLHRGGHHVRVIRMAPKRRAAPKRQGAPQGN